MIAPRVPTLATAGLADQASPGEGSSFWLPPQVSTVSQGVDGLFYLILGISTFFFLLIVILATLFVVRYRRREGRDEADLFNDFATKVSVKVACLANGFPMEDSDYLNGLVWRFFGREEGKEGMTEDGLAAMNEMFGYFAELIQKLLAGLFGWIQI